MEGENKRDAIAMWVLIGGFVSMIATSVTYIIKGEEGVGGEVFHAILPILSTWIGTLLAFYFGKDNFETAAKHYQKIIDKLTPDILDDVFSKQIMIDKSTMVALDIKDERMVKFKGSDLALFLEGIRKSRLPIMDGDKIKYVIHKSLLDEWIKQYKPADKDNEFELFKTKYPKISEFGKVKADDKIEVSLKLLKDNDFKDIFVLDANDNVLGWLTDVHIIRYMNNGENA